MLEFVLRYCGFKDYTNSIKECVCKITLSGETGVILPEKITVCFKRGSRYYGPVKLYCPTKNA